MFCIVSFWARVKVSTETDQITCKISVKHSICTFENYIETFTKQERQFELEHSVVFTSELVYPPWNSF